MTRFAQSGRINRKALLLLAALIVLLGVGVVAAYKIRQRMTLTDALAEGRAAFEKGEWATAAKQFRLYLSKYREDLEVLEQYAQAEISVRPAELKNVTRATAAYRTILRLKPTHDEAYRQLASLYFYLFRNYADLTYVAQIRMENVPEDFSAPIWIARGLVAERRLDEATKVLQELMNKLDQRIPRRFPEYVDACALLSRIAAESAEDSAQADVPRWLNKAVEYDPQSAEARLQRAQHLRSRLAPTMEARQQLLAEARKDLEAVAALQSTDPLIHLRLSEEWRECGDLEKAALELEAVRSVNDATLKKHTIDATMWEILRFNQMTELSLRRANIGEAVKLADKLLEKMKEFRGLRTLMLPQAVKLYAASGRVEDARKYLNEYLEALAVQGAGDNEQVAYLKSLVALVENKPYEVIAALEPVVTRNPAKAPARFWWLLADAYGRTDQSHRAIRALKEYLRNMPRDGETWLRLTREATRRQEWKTAAEALRQAEQLVPRSADTALLRIEIGLQAAAEKAGPARQADLQALAKDLAALRQANPERVDVRLLQARTALRLGQTETAEEELKKAVQECPEPLRAELQLGDLYVLLKRFDKAIEAFQSATKREAASVAAWLGLAEAQRLAAKYADARATLQAGLNAVARPEEKYRLQARQATLEFLHGDKASGLLRLKTLAEENKSDIDLRLMLLNLPEVRRDGATAQKLVDEIKGVEGDNGLLWRLGQAMLWLAEENWRTKQAEIEALLKHCLEADPEWSGPVLVYGQLQERLDKLDDAEQAYQRALTMNSDALDVADRLVALLQRRGKYEAAKRVLDQLQANPRSVSERRLQLALGAGDTQQAIDELKQRVANEPQDVDSRLTLARLLYQRDKNVKAAFQYLDEAEKTRPNAMEILAARIAILRAEGRAAEARQLLDNKVNQTKAFGAYQLRAGFLDDLGETALAEQDYRQLAALGPTGDGYQLLAKFFFDARRLDEAIRAWEEGLQKHPDNLPLKRGLTKALVLRGQPDDLARAAQTLGQLELKFTDDPELIFMRATLLLLERKPEPTEKARQMFERVVKLQPSFVDAHVALINVAMQGNDPTTARQLGTRAQDANPANSSIRLLRAQVERALKNPRAACELAQQVVRESPSNLDAIALVVSLGSDLRDSTVLNDALTQVNEALTKNPNDERLVLAYAQIFSGQNQLDPAIRKLEAFRQTEAGRRSVVSLLALSELYRSKNDWNTSGERLNQALELAPDNLEVLRAKVRWLALQKKFDDLIAWMKEHRAKNPDAVAVFLIAAPALATSSNAAHRQEALALFEHAAKVAPRMTDPQIGIAMVSYQAGDRERAMQAYRKALELDPNHFQALNDLAWLLVEGPHDYQAALELINRAAVLAPNNPNMLDTRAVVLSNFPDRLPDARRDFERCVELAAPDSPARAKALLKLGRLCAKLPDNVAAKKHLEEAQRLDQSLKVFSSNEREELGQLLKKVSSTQ